jgi:chemotaxis protein MotA
LASASISGIVGPIAVRLNAVTEHDAQFYKIIRDVLVAHLHGNAAQVSVEFG